MDNLGIKISKIGEDVKGLVDALKLILSSKFTNMLTVKSQAQDSFIIPNGSYYAIKDIAHGLGYAPAFLLFGWVSGSTKKIMQDGSITVSGIHYGIYAWSTSTHLVIFANRSTDSGNSPNINFKYYILYEKGQ